MVDLEIMQADFTSVGIVDVYSSLMWERRFFEAGYFELTAPATSGNIALLSTGNYIFKTNTTETGVILYKQLADGDSGATITAIGRFLSYLLHGHIVKQKYTISGNAEAAMREMVQNTVMNVGSDDYIPNVRLGALSGSTATVSTIIEYKDLHDALSELSQLSGVGYRLRASPAYHLLYFECYEGADRSTDQTANPQVIFAEEYDNIISGAEYTDDTTAEINAVTARYSGELGEVVVLYNPTGANGTAKKEMYVDGECVTYTDEQGNVQLDIPRTRARLTVLAQEQIAARVQSMSCGVSFDRNTRYKTDFDIGDIVTTCYKQWGIELIQRIYKVTETYDGTGTSVIPTMGAPSPTE